MIPFRFNKASMVGSCPRKRLYSTSGSSVPPFVKMLSWNDLATSLLNIPFYLKSEKASASNTSAHLYP